MGYLRIGVLIKVVKLSDWAEQATTVRVDPASQAFVGIHRDSVDAWDPRDPTKDAAIDSGDVVIACGGSGVANLRPAACRYTCIHEARLRFTASITRRSEFGSSLKSVRLLPRPETMVSRDSYIFSISSRSLDVLKMCTVSFK